MINFNGEQYLCDSLEAVFALQGHCREVLLVDNASGDKSLDIVRSVFPSVRIIDFDTNRGPGAARNAGYRAALHDRILFVDNDVILAPDSAGTLMQALDDHSQAAVAMPRVLYDQNRNIIQYDGAESHFLGLMSLRNADHPLTEADDGIHKISSVVTACFLIDRKRWGHDDPFDESFFFNYEDHDFGMRTRIMGHEILAVNPAISFHRHGTRGLSFREGTIYPHKRVFYLIRNRWQIVMKNFQARTIVLLLPVLFIYEIFQLAGVIKKGWVRPWLQSCSWVFFHLPEIMKKRRRTQQNRRSRDRDILHGGAIPFTRSLTRGGIEKIGQDLLNRITALYWEIVHGCL